MNPEETNTEMTVTEETPSEVIVTEETPSEVVVTETTTEPVVNETEIELLQSINDSIAWSVGLQMVLICVTLFSLFFMGLKAGKN